MCLTKNHDRSPTYYSHSYLLNVPLNETQLNTNQLDENVYQDKCNVYAELSPTLIQLTPIPVIYSPRKNYQRLTHAQ